MRVFPPAGLCPDANAQARLARAGRARRSTRAPADIIVFYGNSKPDNGFAGSHYLALRHYATKMPQAAAFIASPPEGELLKRLHEAHAFWLVIPREQILPPDAFAGFIKTNECYVFGLPRVQRWELATTQPATQTAH